MSPTTVYSLEKLPTRISGRRNNGTIFLAGALPRAGKPRQEPAMWRDQAHPCLDAVFDGIVLTPERRQGAARAYESQAQWEQDAQTMADVIFYYLTRTADVLALSTNTEFGQYAHFGPQRIVLCIPSDAGVALKTAFQQVIAGLNGITPIVGLEAGLAHAVSLIGAGAERTGGECQVPLYVWKTDSFQKWNAALKAAGNRLDGFALEKTLCPVPAFVLYWVARVNIWVASEDRHKSNEWVISRSDISHCVLVYRDSIKTHLVGVSEFRSPVRNTLGRVVEHAGGSSTKPGMDPIAMGVKEVLEETGLQLEPHQVKVVASRQLAATTTAHHAFVMVAELTPEQFAWAQAHQGEYAGNRAETEMTSLTLSELTELFESEVLDWSSLGMAAAALLQVDAAHKPHYTMSTYAGLKYALVVADTLTGSALTTILGFMAAGTTVVYAGHRPGRGLHLEVDISTTLRLFAEKMRGQGIDAQFISISQDIPSQLDKFFAAEVGNVVAFGFAGDYGLGERSAAILELARRHQIPIAGAWAGSTPQPELRIINHALACPDDGYLPFARSWRDMAGGQQLCSNRDAVVVSIGRLTDAAHRQLAALMIAGTHLIYGGVPVGQEAPEGRLHITRTLELMKAKLGVAGIPARFTHFEEPDTEARRSALLGLARRLKAPVLAFVDDLGIAPGVAQECAWAAESGLAVTGLWVGSAGGLEFRVQGDALDVNPDSLATLAKMRLPSLHLS